MTQFDLFSMIFLTLDHYWDEHKGEELGQFLSSMNPFLFEGEGSAVPPVISYGKNILGISTLGDCTVLTLHRIKKV